MFQPLHKPTGPKVTISFEGRPIEASVGSTVAAAVLVAGDGHTRKSPISGQPRAPFCQMGVCFECLMKINGQPNRQACLVLVEDGMIVERQDDLTGTTNE